MRQTARVVVIGGGAVGTSCLWHLARAGIDDCFLIERNELASGSTWHAAGNIPTLAASWLGMRAGTYARRLYSTLGEAVGLPITYRHTGAFWPAHTTDRMDQFGHLVGLSTSAGLNLEMITPGEMEELHPHYTAGTDVIGGILDPHEGDIDPSQLTQALARGARMAGAGIERFTRVTGLERSANGEWKVRTDRGDVIAETVVNAAGFHGAAVARLAGQNIPVTTLKHQYLVTDTIDELERSPGNFPLIRDPDLGFYLRRERAGFLLGSYGHPGRPAFADGLPDDFAHQLFEDCFNDIAGALESALTHIPLLGEAGIRRYINGPIAYSPDALPILGPAYGLDNFYHACGIQVGITQSAVAGKAIAEWITEGETEWDIAAWDPRRFGNWATPSHAAERAIEFYGLQYAIPFPHRMPASARPLRTTPLYETLKTRGAVFGEIGGWERAFWFDRHHRYDVNHLSYRDDEPWRDSVRRECEAIRDHVGVMDHGGFTKFEVEGPGATEFVERVFCGTVPSVGRAKLSYMLTPRGMIWSEATITRLAGDRYLLCGPTLGERRDFDWLRRALPQEHRFALKSPAAHDATLMVMGPASRALLERLTDNDLSKEAMPWFSARQIDVCGLPVIALRISYAGELGFELHLSSDGLAELYGALLACGADTGFTDFGSRALDCLRLEKGYHAWGADIGTEYSVFDAGLQRFVDFDKTDFIGRDAVLRQRESDAAWTFTGFVIEDSDSDPLPGDPLLLDSRPVGYVTSGGMGWRIAKRLSLGYVRSQVADQTGLWEISSLGERHHATRSRLPFYDPLDLRQKL